MLRKFDWLLDAEERRAASEKEVADLQEKILEALEVNNHLLTRQLQRQQAREQGLSAKAKGKLQALSLINEEWNWRRGLADQDGEEDGQGDGKEKDQEYHD